MQRNYFIYGCLFLLICTVAWADSDKLVNAAWEAWEKNDQAAVESNFKAALAADPKNSRAYLGLAYLYNMQEKHDQSWDAFRNIMETAENPYPYVFSGWSFIRRMILKDKANETVEAFWLNIAENGDAEGSLRAMAHQFLGEYYERRNELEKSRAHYAQVNAVDEWALIGPFENVSASGYAKAFPPEETFAPKKSYAGKNGVSTNWFNISAVRADFWIDFERYFAASSAIYYGNNFIYSPTRQTAQIRVGTSGSMKAFLNDALILEYFDENNNDLDTYIAETELQEGWNRLLIKIGHSEIDRANFMVRITDASGHPLPDLKIGTEAQNYPVKPDAPVKLIASPSETYFRKQIEKHPDHLENYLLLAGTYLRNDKAIAGELALRSAMERSPNCAVFPFHLVEAYIRGEKYDEMTTTWEKLGTLDGSIPGVVSYKFQRALDNEQYEEAETFLQNLETLIPNTEILYQAKLQFYSKKRQIEKIIETSEQAYAAFPGNQEFAFLQATILIQTTRSYEKAIEIYQQNLDRQYSLAGLNTLATAYLQDGQIEAWENTYSKIFALDPSAVGFYFQQARTYSSLQNYADAQTAVIKALDICPNNSVYWATLGNIQRAAGETGAAKTAYQKSLTFDPANYDARALLRELEGKPSVFNNFEMEDISELVANSPAKAAYPDDDALIVYNDHKRVVYSGGASELTEELLIKIFNKRGIDSFKEYWVGHNAYNEGLLVEKAVVIKADGSEIKADVDRNHVVFKSLEEGEHIYVKWRIKNYYSGKLANHFWDEFYFNSYYPIKDIRYGLLVPADYKFNHRSQNMTLKPSKKKKDDGILYQWRLSDEPAIVYEYGMPILEDAGKILHISSIEDWEFMVDWYTDIAQTKARSSYEIQAQVKTLFAGKENLSEAEKIQTVYNFITENIRYSSVSFRQSGLIPQEARDVLVNKIGDCKDVSTLCIAMLREVGIDAHYVLVNTRDEGYRRNALPSISFNHCIAGVETENGIQYLDLTANNYPFGGLPAMDIDGFSLLIKKGVTAPQYLEKNQFLESTLARTMKLTITEDGSGKFVKTGVRTGNLAASMRGTYRDEPQSTREKMLLETLTRDHTNVKLESFEISNLNDVNDPVHYAYEYTVPGLVAEVGSFRIVTIPWTDALENDEALSYETRRYPYYYWPAADSLLEDVEIIMPPGYEPAELGNDISLSCNAAEYSLKLTYADGILKAQRLLVNKQAIIPPEEYLDFKQFYNSVVKEDKRQILLKKVAQNQ